MSNVAITMVPFTTLCLVYVRVCARIVCAFAVNFRTTSISYQWRYFRNSFAKAFFNAMLFIFR